MVDVFRGRIRIRQWPRKRGTPKSLAVRLNNSSWRNAVAAIKLASPGQWAQALRITKGTGLYPRDVLLKAMTVGLWDIVLPDGTILSSYRPKVEAVVYQGACIENQAGQNFASGDNIVAFDTPRIDTSLIWDGAQPTRFTVPPTVSRVRLRFSAAVVFTTQHPVTFGWKKNGGAKVSMLPHDTSFNFGAVMDSGPLNVVPGDYFEINVACGGTTGKLNTAVSNWGELVIEEANP